MNGVQKKQQLARMKWFATGLLAAAAILFVIARTQKGLGIWDWIAAFAEAAMIGALADWFAVVALFRHPLGLPIPHTAIIPENKERIADNLAEFVRDKFLGVDALVDKMRALNPAEKIAAWLTHDDNADLLADKLLGVLMKALDFIDDVRVRTALREAIRNRLEQLDVGKLAGRLLDMLTEGDRHQVLLDAGLRKLAAVLDDAESRKTLAGMIVEIAGREYPTVFKVIGKVTDTEEFSFRIATSIVTGINRWLHDIGDDPHHPRRRQFDEAVGDFIERLKNDADYHRRIENWKHELLAEPAVAAYLDSLWGQLKDWLRDDMVRANPQIHREIAAGARNLGRWLADNEGLRDSINDHMADATRGIAADLRDTISHHIANTVKQWEDSELVRELELSIGRDLQFIRVNGTVVGGLIGLLLHALFVALPAM